MPFIITDFSFKALPLKAFALSCSFLVLQACGGSGSSTAKAIVPAETTAEAAAEEEARLQEEEADLAEQTLVFTISHLDAFTGDSVTYTAIGQGSGTISYTSSAPDIVSVDANGNILVLSAGSATINAAITLDDTYKRAYTEYQITALDPEFLITGWVGKTNSSLHFPLATSGKEVHFTREADCTAEWDNLSACEDSAIKIVANTGLIMDSQASLIEDTYLTLRHNEQEAKAELLTTNSNNLFQQRKLHQVVSFQDKLWLIGGQDDNDKNDIWSSVDGLVWTQEVEEAPFPRRSAHQVVVFKEKLWLIGGSLDSSTPSNNNEIYHDDIWSSTDGIEWQQIDIESAEDSPFYGITDHQVVVFKERIWIFGGRNDATREISDSSAAATAIIWSSEDGTSWINHINTDNLNINDLPVLADHQVVEFNNKLWQLHGTDDHWSSSALWTSVDGLNWVDLINEASGELMLPPANSGHQLVVFQNKLWVMGGQQSNYRYTSAIWNSSDGLNWTNVSADWAATDFPSPRYEHQALTHDGQLFMLGGFWAENRGTDTIWSSSNGLDWKKRVETNFNFLAPTADELEL